MVPCVWSTPGRGVSAVSVAAGLALWTVTAVLSPPAGALCLEGAVSICTLGNGCKGQRECYNGRWTPCECSGSQVLSCTVCGIGGTKQCDELCNVGSCKIPEQPCNLIDDDLDGAVDEGSTCTASQLTPASPVGRVYFTVSPGQTITLESRNLVATVPGYSPDTFFHLWSLTRNQQVAWDDDGGSACNLCSRIVYTNTTGWTESLMLFVRSFSWETRGAGEIYRDGSLWTTVSFGGQPVSFNWAPGAQVHLRLVPGGSSDTYLLLLSADRLTMLGFDDDSGPGLGSVLTAPGTAFGTAWASDYSAWTQTGPMGFYVNYLGACSDHDGDGLQDVLDSSVAGGWNSNDPDSDDDGLLDGWEWDGVNDQPLYQMGASPGRRDVFVENDYGGDTTHQHRLGPTIAQSLDALYRTLPLYGPEPGFQGVQVHVVDSSFIADETYADVCNPNANVSRWYYLRDPNKVGLFHWAVGQHWPDSRVAAVVGQGDLWGDRLVYASFAGLGATANYPLVTEFVIYAIAAHELGHNLGLHHSGDTGSPNCEPNYPSLMNYAYDYMAYNPANGCGGYTLASTNLRFSVGGRSPLVESSLTESSGIGPDAKQATFLNCYDADFLGSNYFGFNPANGCVNWDRDGSPCETGAQSVDVTQCAGGSLDTDTDFADHVRIAQALGPSVTSPSRCAEAGAPGPGAGTDAITGLSGPSETAEVRRRGFRVTRGQYPPIVCQAPNEPAVRAAMERDPDLACKGARPVCCDTCDGESTSSASCVDGTWTCPPGNVTPSECRGGPGRPFCAPPLPRRPGKPAPEFRQMSDTDLEQWIAEAKAEEPSGGSAETVAQVTDALQRRWLNPASPPKAQDPPALSDFSREGHAAYATRMPALRKELESLPADQRAERLASLKEEMTHKKPVR